MLSCGACHLGLAPQETHAPAWLLAAIDGGRNGRASGYFCGRGWQEPVPGTVIGAGFETVLAAAQQGSEAAFAELWHDANPVLLRYLRAIVPDIAEDIAAETWVQVVRGLGGFRGNEQNWRAWLFTTARRRVADQARRKARRPAVSLEALPDLAMAELTGLHGPDAATLALENLDTRTAIALVARLPPQQAEVIMLRVVAGLEPEVVADMLGRSPGAVRVAAHRGLRRLAGMLAEAGVTR